MSDHYDVLLADPDGFWLVPSDDRGPEDWCWMEQASPCVEIERLRARVEELERLLRRYRRETPSGNQPAMISHEVDELLKRWRTDDE